jgi:hypothetical protein
MAYRLPTAPPKEDALPMELIDLLTQLKHLDYSQKKYHVDSLGEYVQLVFNPDHLQTWLDAISKLLGPPIKTEEQPVTEDILRLTENVGEIFDHQTLYYREIEGQSVMAMLWPWSSQEAITLKIMIFNRG